ncbi:MAG: HSP90 family protein [Arachnia sp.]
MAQVAETASFQVDLRGMISLLGRHLYSRPQVFVRELLQNSVDAITARARAEGAADPAWGVRIHGADGPGGEVVCEDDGVGMTVDEINEVLATVGRSSKRDVFDLPVTDYLGQFGIGLLSCFMVTDEVVVTTRSAGGGPALRWVGRSSGVFRVEELDGSHPVGTTVRFVPRADEAAVTSRRAVREAVREYAEYLPTPVLVDGAHVGARAVWAESPASLDDDALALLDDLGATLLGARPLARIPLRVPGTDLAGTAFVLPYPPSPSARQAHRVYLGRMLVTDACDTLLPEWAFFVRCLVTTTSAHPTASREQLVDDDALAHIRDGLGAALRQWIDRTGREQPGLLADFVAVHHLGLRSVAAHDPALAAAVVPWLPFETSAGRMTLGAFARRWPTVRYVAAHDEFDTVSSLARPDEPVLNAGYVYDADLLRQLPLILPGVACVEVTAAGMLEALASPAESDLQLADTLRRRAADALDEVGCQPVVRVFEPRDATSFLVADPDLWRRLERRNAQAAPGLWSSMLDALSTSAPIPVDDDAPASRLCLNWANPTVRRLATMTDGLVAARILRVLYCQAVLSSHRPLGPAERGLLAGGLDDLLALSLNEDTP